MAASRGVVDASRIAQLLSGEYMEDGKNEDCGCHTVTNGHRRCTEDCDCACHGDRAETLRRARKEHVQLDAADPWALTDTGRRLAPAAPVSMSYTDRDRLAALNAYLEMSEVAADPHLHMPTEMRMNLTGPQRSMLKRWMAECVAMADNPVLLARSGHVDDEELMSLRVKDRLSDLADGDATGLAVRLMWDRYTAARLQGRMLATRKDALLLRRLCKEVTRDYTLWNSDTELLASVSMDYAPPQPTESAVAAARFRSAVYEAAPDERYTGVTLDQWRVAVQYDPDVANTSGTITAGENPLELKWANKEALREVTRLTAQWGQPSAVGVEQGGSAIWRRVPVPVTASDASLGPLWFREYYEVGVEDTVRIHNTPAPHVDFITYRVRLQRGADDDDDVNLATALQLSDSVGVQQLPGGSARLLACNCHYENMHHATLMLTAELLRGRAQGLTLGVAQRRLAQLGTHASATRERLWRERGTAPVPVAEGATSAHVVAAVQGRQRKQRNMADYEEYCRRTGDANTGKPV